MTLQEKLDQAKAQFKEVAPAEAIATIERSTEDLIESGQAEFALKAGSKAPEFVLKDTNGNDVALRDLLANGPLVLTFFRGFWCTYCNLDLHALEEVADEIREKGATIAAVSMQSVEESQKSMEETNLSFPVLQDRNGELVKKFGVRWTLQPYAVTAYKLFGVDLPTLHDDGQWNLPMSARYVIDQDRTILFAEINPDYTRRLDPANFFPILDKAS